MEIIWILSEIEINHVKAFVSQRYDNAFVRYRVRKNIEAPPTYIAIETFWETMIGCLLTSQQRSGPDSAVSRFLRQKPFPLHYGLCKTQANLSVTAESILVKFGGIRFTNRIGRQLQGNLAALERGLWDDTDRMLHRLVGKDSQIIEREAAEFLRERFIGLGPKQSRNLLQGLGLSRYEIPIDSRITKWLNEFGFPVTLSANALSDPHFYNFISNGVQAMCAQCNILPCVLDAAIFSSYDIGWTDENILW